MDLINSLAGAVGIDNDQAQALAGTVLGGVQDAVGENDQGAAAQLGEAVPELDGWKGTAASMLGGGGGGGGGLLGSLTSGGGGGLLGAAAGALGGEQAQDTAAIVGVLAQFDVDADKATLVAPVLLKFLQSRVDEELLSKILSAAPLLAGLVGGDDDGDAKSGGLGGALGGALGGLLGGR
jgi:hypothetical protein